MTIDDELQALLLLGSLPGSWETFLVTVSNSTPNGVLTMGNVKDIMFYEETSRKVQVHVTIVLNIGRDTGILSKTIW